MNYRATLLVTGGVMLGALTFSAIGVSAYSPGNGDESGERPRRQGFGMMEHRRSEGKKYAAEVLGLTPEEIKAEIESGKTMEEVVLAQGYTSIESFREEVQNKVRERMAAAGLSEEEINQRIERHKVRREHRLEHMSENFDEDAARERMQNRGLNDEQIENRMDRIQERMGSFTN